MLLINFSSDVSRGFQTPTDAKRYRKRYRKTDEGFVKFVDTIIKNMRPESKEYEVREDSGLGLRVHPSGTKTWFMIYHYNKKRKRFTLGKYPSLSLSEAREKYKDKRKLVEKGLDPKEEEFREKREHIQAPTVKDLKKEFIEDYAKPKKRTWRLDDLMIEKDVIPEIGEMKAKDVTRRDINLILKNVMKRGAPRQANKVLAATRKMFNYAVSAGILDYSPCHLIKPPAENKVKDRTLSDEEIKLFWNDLETIKLDEVFRCIFRLILITGQRPSEVSAMRSGEIEGDWWVISSERMKNGRSHRVFLTPLAKQFIPANLPKHKDAPVFPAKLKEGYAMADSLGRRLRDNYFKSLPDREKFTAHDLRRTTSTGMAKLGITPYIVDRVMSHIDQTVRGRHYDRYDYDKEKQEALEKWSRHLEKLINEGTDDKKDSNVIHLFK